MKQVLQGLIFVTLLLPTMKSFGQTSSIEKQAQKIISQLKGNGEYPVDAMDTLIDLNGDGFKDLLIEYYGAAGTGLKNRITVYLYDEAKKKLKSCETLNDLANPTFYFKNKIVVGYYIANGGGSATKLKWHGLRLDTLEHIEVDVSNKGDQTIFSLTAYNFVSKKKTTKIVDAMELPKEYKYFHYQPIIKRRGQ